MSYMFNAKIGEGQYEDNVGKYGLGERNPRGDRLLYFCIEKKPCYLKYNLPTPKTVALHLEKSRRHHKKPDRLYPGQKETS